MAWFWLNLLVVPTKNEFPPEQQREVFDLSFPEGGGGTAERSSRAIVR